MENEKIQQMKPLLINTKEVAILTGMSVRWVILWRHRIVGARRIGRVWRFEESHLKISLRCICKKLRFADAAHTVTGKWLNWLTANLDTSE